jgi:drug/metabolite transporter (DMT)-like permease
MNFRRAISSKLVSVLLFAVMSSLVRYVGETVPLGQVVFFRSAFAIIPVMVIYAWRGELGAALRTGRAEPLILLCFHELVRFHKMSHGSEMAGRRLRRRHLDSAAKL